MHSIFAEIPRHSRHGCAHRPGKGRLTLAGGRRRDRRVIAEPPACTRRHPPWADVTWPSGGLNIAQSLPVPGPRGRDAPFNSTPERFPMHPDSTRPLWQRFSLFLIPLMASNILQALSGTINSIYVGQMIG